MSNFTFELSRPWGKRIGLTSTMDQVSCAILEIRAGEKLSFQFHEFRDEMFYALTEVFVQDAPNVRDFFFRNQIDPKDEQALRRLRDEIYRGATTPRKVEQGETIFFERYRPHRFSAPEDKDATCIEIARGVYRQSDIVRIDDKFDRKAIGDKSDNIDMPNLWPRDI